MAYKFEDLEGWTRALDYSDQLYDISEQRPKHERYNLADQMTGATNSIAENVAVSLATAQASLLIGEASPCPKPSELSSL
ncbi:four helix bundle protein [Salinibacter sp.]|uniref:four helix bundle protein n=1 Tax=Salinibacter sp. TaxID=2065818 RepID=UPI0021E906B7|nr:four helix bundle protein [Salinibacter sp.]